MGICFFRGSVILPLVLLFSSVNAEIIENNIVVGVDLELTENLTLVGRLENGMNVYSWTWNESKFDVVASLLHVDNMPESGSGFIAQEIEKVFPSAVYEGLNGLKFIDPDELLSLDPYLYEKMSAEGVERCGQVENTRFKFCF